MSIVTLKNPIDKYTKCKIDITYDLGSYNYFFNTKSSRGYYINFTPCNIRNDDFGTVTEFELMHKRRFKLLIKSVDRKSKKTNEHLINFLFDNIDKIQELYEANDDIELYKFIIEKSHEYV